MHGQGFPTRPDYHAQRSGSSFPLSFVPCCRCLFKQIASGTSKNVWSFVVRLLICSYDLIRKLQVCLVNCSSAVEHDSFYGSTACMHGCWLPRCWTQHVAVAANGSQTNWISYSLSGRAEIEANRRMGSGKGGIVNIKKFPIRNLFNATKSQKRQTWTWNFNNFRETKNLHKGIGGGLFTSSKSNINQSTPKEIYVQSLRTLVSSANKKIHKT